LANKEWKKLPRRRQGIATKWTQLLDRVSQSHPDFKRLSFKWVRKTGSSIIREIADGEISSLYISHGKGATTSDQLLNVYADQRWVKLGEALEKFHQQLVPALRCEAPPQRVYIPLTVIDTIKRMWDEGMKPEAIAKKTGKSRATVYRYRPAQVVSVEV
jgi:hypothetical protein